MEESSPIWNRRYKTGYDAALMRESRKFGELEIFHSSNNTIRETLRGFAVVDTILIVASLFLNILVLVVICGSKGGRAAVSMTAVSISVSNLVITLFVHPTSILLWYVPPIAQPVLCKFSVYFDCWMSTAISYSILALHVDRYFAVTSPEGSTCRSLSGHCMFYQSFVWFFGAAYSAWDLVFEFPQKISIHDTFTNISIKVCRHTGKFRTLEYIFQYLDIFVLFLLPLCIIFCLFISVFKWKYVDKNPPKRRQIGSTGIWSLTMAVVYTTVYLVCHLPNHILDLSWNTQDINIFSLDSYSTMKTLRVIKYSSCSILPIVYFICGHEVKSLVQKLIKRSSTNTGSVVTTRALLYIEEGQ